MQIERVLNAVREALLWMGPASGDPLALDVAHRQGQPSLADQMTEILDAISDHERKWHSSPRAENSPSTKMEVGDP
jgi:hypothetical protein